jgi:hypothetical protein
MVRITATEIIVGWGSQSQRLGEGALMRLFPDEDARKVLMVVSVTSALLYTAAALIIIVTFSF